MMLKLVILYTVATIVTLSICGVESNTRRKVDIDGILDLLQQRNHNYLRQKSDDVTSDESSLAELRVQNDKDSHYGSLTSREIIELIQQATRDITNHNRNSKDKLYGKSYRPTHESNLDKYTEKYLPTNYENEPKLEKPSSQSGRYRERRYPSKIRNEVLDNLDDYSKVYIILNPSAIQKSKSKDSLSNMITKILSLSNRNEREHTKKEQYYKEFPIISDLLSRRLKRDSRETFDVKDSMEDTRNQKRSRNDYAGGGGSGGGRTAIPYIRQRGDIYERDK